MFTCSTGLCQHGCQHTGIEVAHIQRRFTTSHHRCHNSWKSLNAAHRRNSIRMFPGDRPYLERQLRSSSQRIPAHGHRSRSRVCLLTMKGDCVALYALCAEHNAKRKPHFLEDRPLLDMQLKIRSRATAFSASVADPVHVDITVSKSLFQTDSVAVLANAVNSD